MNALSILKILPKSIFILELNLEFYAKHYKKNKTGLVKIAVKSQKLILLHIV